MQAIPQIEPVTSLQRGYRALFDKLVNGPVILSNQGRATAVLVSADDWDAQAKRLAWFERQAAADLAIEADEWISDEEVTAEFARMGIA